MVYITHRQQNNPCYGVRMQLLEESEVRDRLASCTPLMPFGPNGRYYWEVNESAHTLYTVEPPDDLFGVSFLSKQSVALEPVGELELVGQVGTLHVMSSGFNPTIAEVLSQVPPEMLERAEYFQTKHDYPQPTRTVEGETFHVARTFLYCKAE